MLGHRRASGGRPEGSEPDMSTPVASRSTRLLVYSHDAFGLGNLRRMMKICDQLAKEIPDLTILLLTGSSMVHSFRLSPKIDYIKLPCVHRQARNSTSASPAHELRRDRSMREGLVFAAFKASGPTSCWSTRCRRGIKGELSTSCNGSSRTSQAKSSSDCATSSTIPSGRSCGKQQLYRPSRSTTTHLGVRVAGGYDMGPNTAPARHRSKLNYCGYISRARPARQSRDPARARSCPKAASCW